MKVSEIMSRGVVSLAPEMTLEQAAERLVQEGISGAPVVDARGRLIGVLSESDLLRRLNLLAEDILGRRYVTDKVRSLALLAFLADRREGAVEGVYAKLRETRVEDAMTTKVFSVGPDASVEAAASVMVLHDVNRVPVVQAGKLVGIVSRADLARVVASGRGTEPRL